jgi:hypothetical protein
MGYWSNGMILALGIKFARGLGFDSQIAPKFLEFWRGALTRYKKARL